MTDFVEKLKTNHQIHGLLIGGGVYYLMKKNGNDNALKYGVITGLVTGYYMSVYGHNAPNFDNMFTDFNKELAELTGT